MSFSRIYRLVQPRTKRQQKAPTSTRTSQQKFWAEAETGDLVLSVLSVSGGEVFIRLLHVSPGAACTLELIKTSSGEAVVRTDTVPDGPLCYVTLQLPDDFVPDGSLYTVRLTQKSSLAHEDVKLVYVNHHVVRSFETLDQYLENKQSQGTDGELFPYSTEQEEAMARLSNSDFVNYLYHWLLGRAADPGGFQSHVTRLEEGITREQLTGDVLKSDESMQHRRLASVRGHNDVAYPFSSAHGRLRDALGVVANDVR